MDILTSWLNTKLIDEPNERQSTSVAEFNNLLLLKSWRVHHDFKINFQIECIKLSDWQDIDCD